MAVKIFCNSCQKFIKDASPNEISLLRGTEICVDCEGKFSEVLLKIEKIAKTSMVKIERARDDAKVKIDEAMHNVMEGEDGT
jgi:hypothetical protein